MPEIGEVARVVHYIRQNLVGKTLVNVIASEDANVFGKVGTSAAEVQKSLTGKRVVDARQQGKYFWMAMSSPPHVLMHFGMAGWFKFRNEDTFYYKPSKQEDPEWPPKYWKFMVETAEEPKCEAAFVDFRRFARIRLVDCDADNIRNVPPLAENGPDPVIDKDIFTEEWLSEKLGSKKIPVKALLLDQANISGIGNWVGDEILYDARIHPEQYSNTLNSTQISQLHRSIQYVCGFAVKNLADSSKFPEEWLFKHRWGKGKKDSKTTLPNGSRFVFLTVGGRTSCVVPSVQKKTGPVAKEVEGGNESIDEGDLLGMKKENGKKALKAESSVVNKEEDKAAPGTSKGQKRGIKKDEQLNGNMAANDGEQAEEGNRATNKKRKPNPKPKSSGPDTVVEEEKKIKPEANVNQKGGHSGAIGSRKSSRTSKKH